MLGISPFFTVYILVLAFLFGAVFASFLGCVAWRISKGESFLKGRSHCDVCNHPLGAKDLVPIASYLAKKGRCAYCKAPIPKSSLIGEILLAMLFVLAVLRFDISPKLVLALVFICILYVVALTDLYEQIIPDGCLLIAIVVRVVYYFVVEHFEWNTFLALFGNGLSISLPLLLLTLLMEKILKKEAMGGGDIKLVFVTGLYLGWQNNLLMMFFACVIGIIIGFIQAQKDTDEDENYFPFGPSIAIGAVITLFVGDALIGWYLSLF